MTDREQLLALYGACFPEDDPHFWNWVFDNLYREENTLTVRENGTIVASLQMIPCEMQLEERRFSAHYIYAAATLPCGSCSKILLPVTLISLARTECGISESYTLIWLPYVSRINDLISLA